MSDAPPIEPDTAPHEPERGAGLLRSSGIVAVGTLLSRVTGLLRTILTGWIIGVASIGAAYNLANNTPNMIYDLLLGGVLTATLVPALVANRENGDDRGTDAVLTVSTVVLFVITIATVILAPLIIALYVWIARGGASPMSIGEQELSVSLLRLFAPQILFYGLSTLGGAFLNAHRRFAAAAFAPVVNNIWMIVLLVGLSQALGTKTPTDVTSDVGLLLLLGMGTTLGILAMTLVLWPAIRRADLHVHWRFDLDDPAVRRVARLSGWTLGYVVANQVTLFIVVGRAGGDNAIWTLAYQFFQLPYGIFAVSIMTTFTPELAALHDRGERRAFGTRFLHGLRLIVLVLLPATIGFALLAGPIVQGILEHGDYFPVDKGVMTASTMAAFAWGMLGFSLYLYVLRAFYARKDTRTPFLINLAENALTLLLVFIFGTGVTVPELAWSWTLAYTISAVVAFVVLRRRTGPFGLRAAVATTAPIARMIVAAVAMTAVVFVLVHVLPGGNWGLDLVTVVVAGTIGLGVYGGVCLVLGVDEVRALPRLILRR
jgi:putative peptidoglycan lipid II flippase